MLSQLVIVEQGPNFFTYVVVFCFYPCVYDFVKKHLREITLPSSHIWHGHSTQPNGMTLHIVGEARGWRNLNVNICKEAKFIFDIHVQYYTYTMHIKSYKKTFEYIVSFSFGLLALGRSVYIVSKLCCRRSAHFLLFIEFKSFVASLELFVTFL